MSRAQTAVAARQRATPEAATPFSGWRYGALGLPLAFVSLPLYVTLPHHYADQLGVPLAALGLVLLATRALDALLDPLIGRWVDSLFAVHSERAWRAAAVAAAFMALGFAALWLPPVAGSPALLGWLAAALVVTYVAFSLVSVVHQAWGARWGGPAPQRASIVAWREGAALAGVVLASVLPTWLGLNATSAVLAATLAIGMMLLARSGELVASNKPLSPVIHALHSPSPWSSAAFRALLAVFVLNGIASAIPATLLPFFVSDRLQAASSEPLFLATYFACAALGLPLWVRFVRHLGLARTWLVGMALSVATFSFVLTLGAGDTTAFFAVCAASGVALGADLAVPGALLTGVVKHAGAAERGEGQFFGWWACATKLNLALAAGVALPALAWAGYSSGAREPSALAALSLAYGALPCMLKLAAAATLWWAQRRHLALGVPA